jgi:hypothetical protein
MARRGREEGKERDRTEVRKGRGRKSEEQKGKEIGEGPRTRREKR